MWWYWRTLKTNLILLIRNLCLVQLKNPLASVGRRRKFKVWWNLCLELNIIMRRIICLQSALVRLLFLILMRTLNLVLTLKRVIKQVLIRIIILKLFLTLISKRLNLTTRVRRMKLLKLLSRVMRVRTLTYCLLEVVQFRLARKLILNLVNLFPWELLFNSSLNVRKLILKEVCNLLTLRRTLMNMMKIVIPLLSIPLVIFMIRIRSGRYILSWVQLLFAVRPGLLISVDDLNRSVTQRYLRIRVKVRTLITYIGSYDQYKCNLIMFLICLMTRLRLPLARVIHSSVMLHLIRFMELTDLQAVRTMRKLKVCVVLNLMSIYLIFNLVLLCRKLFLTLMRRRSRCLNTFIMVRFTKRVSL